MLCDRAKVCTSTVASFKKNLSSLETSLVVQRLRLHAFDAGDVGSIPGLGTKIPHAVQCSQEIFKK